MDESVPERLLPGTESLRSFRRSHPVQSVSAAGEQWEYYTGGEGRQLLVLPGAGESAEMWLQHVTALEPDYWVILLDYPRADSVEDLVAGAMAVLDTEYVERTDVVGYSLGGALAQVLVREYPDRFENVVVSNATTPAGTPTEFFRRLTQFAPLHTSRLLAPFARERSLDEFPGEDAEFWDGYLGDVLDEVAGDESLLTGPRCLVDYAQSYDFESPADWDGELTVVETDDDAVVDADARAAMREAYPDARVITVEGAGHSLPFVAREEFLATVRQALR